MSAWIGFTDKAFNFDMTSKEYAGSPLVSE